MISNTLNKIGAWFARKQQTIRRLQWIIILLYACLIIIPPFLPLPNEASTIVNNFTVFAQFLFWGVWWPFVLLSIIFFGRLWCGILCPEGALSEFANRYGKRRGIPQWMKWGGWPFIAFLLTTLYGQMTSVYQYPKPVVVILGGSTIAAMIIGFLYGKDSRVWCKYLCPVSGVFALLSRLAPFYYKANKINWNRYSERNVIPIHCPTLQPLRTMTGSAQCLMCGKCNNHRNAIQLRIRSPNEEILMHGKNTSIWESLLVVYGLCGIALAAFQWTNSFWLAHLRDVVDSWLLSHNIMWVFNTNAPWWIFTNYVNQDDVFTWIFGFELIIYIVGIGFILGAIITLLLSCVTILVHGRFSLKIFNHLSLALIPLGAVSVFIGLFALTITLLEKYANQGFLWVPYFKVVLLFLASLWSCYLSYMVIKIYTSSLLRRINGMFLMLLTYAIINYSWVLVLHIWVIKSDKIPWNTLWVHF